MLTTPLPNLRAGRQRRRSALQHIQSGSHLNKTPIVPVVPPPPRPPHVRELTPPPQNLHVWNWPVTGLALLILLRRPIELVVLPSPEIDELTSWSRFVLRLTVISNVIYVLLNVNPHSLSFRPSLSSWRWPWAVLSCPTMLARLLQPKNPIPKPRILNPKPQTVGHESPALHCQAQALAPRPSTLNL